MKFIDEAKIIVRSGSGGNGCVSFRRERFIPKGGPDGGDGGHGGNVILKATRRLRTLVDFKYKRHYFADDGQKGGGNNRTGRSASDVIIELPVGTVITDASSGEVLVDLVQDEQVHMLYKGGRGGKGNSRFKSSTNQSPQKATSGKPGTEKEIGLELKLLADVAIVGFPNAGKSTFIKTVSNAKPKVADYPFTTLSPNLGVVRVEEFKSFVVVDVPGLIEGAHKGKGLGIQFLKHIERSKVLLHLVEASEDVDDIIARFETIQSELSQYSDELIKRPMIVAVSKIDIMPDHNWDTLSAYFESKQLKWAPISSVAQMNLDALIQLLSEKVFQYTSSESDSHLIAPTES